MAMNLYTMSACNFEKQSYNFTDPTKTLLALNYAYELNNEYPELLISVVCTVDQYLVFKLTEIV
jgi:hypothetical protein